MKKTFLVILMLIFLSACNSNSKSVDSNNGNKTEVTAGKEKTEQQQNSKLSNDSNNANEEIAFEKRVSEFNEVYKEALTAVEEGNDELAGSLAAKTNELWRKIVNEYKDNQPKKYARLNDWSDDLNDISIYTQEAKGLVENGNYNDAYEELIMVRRDLRRLRYESGIFNNISDKMLGFNDVMKKVVKAETREDAEVHFNNLNLSLRELAAYHPDNSEYQRMYKELEAAVEKVINLTGEDFNNVKEQMKAGFDRIYRQFG